MKSIFCEACFALISLALYILNDLFYLQNILKLFLIQRQLKRSIPLEISSENTRINPLKISKATTFRLQKKALVNVEVQGDDRRETSC